MLFSGIRGYDAVNKTLYGQDKNGNWAMYNQKCKHQMVTISLKYWKSVNDSGNLINSKIYVREDLYKVKSDDQFTIDSVNYASK